MLTQKCPRCHSSRVQRGFQDPPFYLRLFGIHELLCNNCNMEFRGYAVPGLVKRVASKKEETTVNRRRAPRFQATLPVTVSLIDLDTVRSGLSFSKTVDGYTNSLSRTGLGFVLPHLQFGSTKFNGVGQRLHLKLDLPAGSVQLRVTVAHVNELPQRTEASGRWLVGAGIVRIGEPDRELYLEYLETLQKQAAK